MRLMFFVAIFLVSHYLQAFQCKELFDKTLSSAQLLWLDAASKVDYDVQLLKSPSGQKLVLFGETHLKNIYASLIGKRVLLEFQHRAHEAFISEKTWGGEFFSIYLQSVFKEAQSTTDRSQTSTIRDAEMPLSQLLYSLNEMAKHLEKNGKIKSAPISLKSYNNDYKNYYLENNHKPDLKENLYSVIVPAEYMAKVLLLPTALLSLLNTNGFMVEQVLPTLVFFIGARSIHKYLGENLSVDYAHKPWYNTIFFDKRALLDARDKTKAQNIAKILRENPEINTLLVIVGKLHTEGIKKHLEEMDFSE